MLVRGGIACSCTAVAPARAPDAQCTVMLCLHRCIIHFSLNSELNSQSKRTSHTFNSDSVGSHRILHDSSKCDKMPNGSSGDCDGRRSLQHWRGSYQRLCRYPTPPVLGRLTSDGGEPELSDSSAVGAPSAASSRKGPIATRERSRQQTWGQRQPAGQQRAVSNARGADVIIKTT